MGADKVNTMPKSKLAQNPQALPARAAAGSEHHYIGRSLQQVECSIFDNAAYFSVATIPAPGRRERQEFSTFQEAMQYALPRPTYVAYAVTASGRSLVIDRDAYAG